MSKVLYNRDDLCGKQTDGMPIYLNNITFKDNYQRTCEQNWKDSTVHCKPKIQNGIGGWATAQWLNFCVAHSRNWVRSPFSGCMSQKIL